jgi:hypothetical protein
VTRHYVSDRGHLEASGGSEGSEPGDGDIDNDDNIGSNRGEREGVF